MNIATKIKFIRKNILNLKTEEFSQLLGVSRRTISSWENNKALPALINLIKLSVISDISLDSILNEESDLKLICNDISEDCFNSIQVIVAQYESINKDNELSFQRNKDL